MTLETFTAAPAPALATARAWWREANDAERLTAVFALPWGVAVWLVLGHRHAAALALLLDAAMVPVALVLLPRMRRSANPVARYFGVALPLGLFYALYMQTGIVDVAAVHWRDAELLRMQELVLPRVPAISSVPVRDGFIAAYFAYPVVLPLGILALLLPWSPDHMLRAERAVVRILYSFVVCYIIALAYPTLSPRFVMPALQRALLGDTAVGHLGLAVQGGAMVLGSSFPSAHLSATTTLLWDIWHARRRLFWALLPVCVCMSAGTVLFLYHYVPDVVAGVAVGLLAIATETRLRERRVR